jgi:hypothetical protein
MTTPEPKMGPVGQKNLSEQKLLKIKVVGNKVMSLICLIIFFDLMKFFDSRNPFLVLELSFLKTFLPL